ncbi:MAG: sensor histidine kinase [Candidatus Parabeggiatoa sp.]|nr:sensor histidine kinase [Candidatus Parabeggiatoa sp.]
MYNTLEELKTALQQELSKEQFNFERISELNERLLALDPQATRFTVDAQHIHRLGFELVGKQETALSELIKNAYDADATYISIDFKDYDKAGGTLIIRDDGNGMTSLDIRDNWMRLSTSDKEKNPISPRYGRSRAGRKGIGRFAVERLGKQLLLETKKKDETKQIRVYFDWENQYQSGKLLTQITNLIEQVIAEQNIHGTTLNIGKLRDKWTKNDFIQIWKYVLFLQPPFEIPLRHRASQNDSETYAPDPGFKVFLNSQLRNEAVPAFSLEKRFLANRTALIKGWIDTEGKGYFQVHSEILEFEEKQDSEDNYQDVGPLEFEVSYFIYDSKLISKVNEARKFGKQLGGIRIYRDGFRVLPYGESNNDWLQLVIGERNRLLNAKNENFFGHVALTSAENPTLEETASREGLVENEAYKKLCDFINECLEWAVLRVASYRHRQLDFKLTNRKPSNRLQQLINESKQKTKKEIISELKEIKKEEDEKELERKELIRYTEMLRVLASLGISIAVFSHETGGAVTRLKASLMNLQSLTLSVCQNSSEINEHFGQVEQTTNDLGELANYINAQIDSSVKRNKDNIALYAVIQTFIKQFQNYLNTWKIVFEWDVTPNYLRTALMHYSEINAVLFNFLTNAIKAMERSNVEQRRIKVTATKQDNFAIIRFQDTGAGVADNIKNRIFDAFFTTSAQNRKDEIAGPGCGLGLKIVSDIAKVNKGFVRLSEPDTGYGCCFEFAVPISSKQLKLSEV